MLNKLAKLTFLTAADTAGVRRLNPLYHFTRLPVALQHSLLYASALILAKGLGFIMVPFTTHYLSLAEYGRLDVLQTLADLLSIVIAMGLTETLYRYASGSENADQNSPHASIISPSTAAANIFGLTLLIAASSLIFTQLLAGVISQWLPGDISALETRLILASICLGGIVIVPLSWFRIKDRAWQFFLASGSMALIQVTLAIVLLVLGFGVVGVLSATFVAISLLSGYLIKVQLADTGIAFSLTLFKRYTRYGGPLVFVGIAGFVLGSFDRWILAASIGTASMASYALACKFGLLTAVLIQPFDMWWHAKRFSYLKAQHGRALCAKYASMGVIIALFSALLITVTGPILVRLLSPVEYHGAVNYIPYLAFLAALHSINNSINLGMLSGETTWSVAAVDAAAALLALIGYLAFIPVFNIWGAMLATAIALTFRVLISFIISQKHCPIPYPSCTLGIQIALTLLAIHFLPRDALSLKNVFIYSSTFIALAVSAVQLKLLPNPIKKLQK